MVGEVGVHIKSLPALLNMGKPIALEGNVIIIGFDYPIFKDKFDKEVKAVVAKSADFSQTSPEPAPDELYTDVYIEA